MSKGEQIKTAAAQVEAAKGQYDSAQAQVAYSEIRSPLTGVVTDWPFYAGEMANPGSPLLTVMDMSSVVARVNMAEEQAKDLKVGDEATLTPAGGGEPVPGKVTVVSPAVDPNSTTVQVWVQAANPGERLRAGTSVRVAIVAGTLGGAVLIPADGDSAERRGRHHRQGGRRQGRRARRHRGQIGVKEGDLVQVVSGVAPGERVVTVGGLGLDDKAKVRIVKPGEKNEGDDGEKDGKDGKRAGSDGAHRALDGPARQADHLRHPDARRGRHLPRADDSGRRLSRGRIFRACWSAWTTAWRRSTRCWSP